MAFRVPLRPKVRLRALWAEDETSPARHRENPRHRGVLASPAPAHRSRAGVVRLDALPRSRTYVLVSRRLRSACGDDGRRSRAPRRSPGVASGRRLNGGRRSAALRGRSQHRGGRRRGRCSLRSRPHDRPPQVSARGRCASDDVQHGGAHLHDPPRDLRPERIGECGLSCELSLGSPRGGADDSTREDRRGA